jgi:predicted secreted protein
LWLIFTFFSNLIGFGIGGLSQFSRGLVWASLALRPLWWVALLLFLPVMTAAGAPDSTATPAEVSSIGTTFNIISSLLNVVTEDIGVNIFGGLWFILVGVMMQRQRTFAPAFAWSAIVIGLVYLLSSGEIFGLAAFEGGNPIPTLVSIAGPLWLLAAGVVAVRLNRA